MGMANFTAAMGIPSQLYAPYFCGDSPYPSNFSMVRSDTTLPGCKDMDFWDASPESAVEFYEFLYSLGQSYGMTMYEPDFLDSNHLCVRRFIEEVGAGDAFFNAQAAVAEARGIPIQWCFVTPYLLAWTLGAPAVTNFRVSNDYFYGGSWDIGRSSLLVWSLGGKPSKDTFWTSDNGNVSTSMGGCNPGGCPPDHSNAGAVLHTLLAVFSTGPVGFSDAPGHTNVSLIMRVCDGKGGLLQPSKPVTAVDSTFSPDPAEAPSGHVLSTHTELSGAVLMHYVISHSLSVEYTLGAVDLFWPKSAPPPEEPTLYVSISWDGLGACVREAASAEAVSPTTASCPPLSQPPFPIPTPPGQSGKKIPQVVLPATPTGGDPFTPTLTLIAPLCPGSGLGLLGEVDKFVTVSVQRFLGFHCTTTGLSFLVEGVAGESVRFAFADGNRGSIGLGNFTFPSSAGGAPSSALCTASKIQGTLSCASQQ